MLRVSQQSKQPPTQFHWKFLIDVYLKADDPKVQDKAAEIPLVADLIAAALEGDLQFGLSCTNVNILGVLNDGSKCQQQVKFQTIGRGIDADAITSSRWLVVRTTALTE